MKALRTIFVLSFVIILIIFSWQCSEDNNLITNNNSNQPFSMPKKHNESDGAGEKVYLYVQDSVKITPDSGPVYYTWLQLQGFTSCGCFPPYNMKVDSFTTRSASSYIYGLGTVDELGPTFRFILDADWTCQTDADGSHVSHWIYNGQDTHVAFNTGTSCITIPYQYTGSYSLTTVNYTNMSNSTTYHIQYGTDYLTGDHNKAGK